MSVTASASPPRLPVGRPASAGTSTSSGRLDPILLTILVTTQRRYGKTPSSEVSSDHFFAPDGSFAQPSLPLTTQLTPTIKAVVAANFVSHGPPVRSRRRDLIP